MPCNAMSMSIMRCLLTHWGWEKHRSAVGRFFTFICFPAVTFTSGSYSVSLQPCKRRSLRAVDASEYCYAHWLPALPFGIVFVHIDLLLDYMRAPSWSAVPVTASTWFVRSQDPSCSTIIFHQQSLCWQTKKIERLMLNVFDTPI